MTLQILDVAGFAGGLTESAVVEPHSLDVVLCQLVCQMCAVSDVRVEPVEHEHYCDGLLACGVAVGG